MLSEKTKLSYSEYGYWDELDKIEGDNGLYELRSVAIQLIGGMESKRIDEKNLNGKIVFNGNVIANIKEENKNPEDKLGEIEYKLKANKEKKLTAKFNDWYEIEINSKEKDGLSDWIFKGNYKENFTDGEGIIKDIRYYGENDKLESVGILEYINSNNTHLTLTFGAKN